MIFKNIISLEGTAFRFNIFGRAKNTGLPKHRILFIDDEDFPVINNLQKAGWTVQRIKDIRNVHDPAVEAADVIFVDYKGVGRTLSENEQGIGVIKAIKNEYEDAKRVILYSGYGHFDLSMDMRVADNQLPKNADTYQFIKMIESEIKKLK